MQTCTTPFDWQAALRRVGSDGPSYSALARGVASPSLVSRLATGAQRSTSFDTGVALLIRLQDLGVDDLPLQVTARVAQAHPPLAEPTPTAPAQPLCEAAQAWFGDAVIEHPPRPPLAEPTPTAA